MSSDLTARACRRATLALAAALALVGCKRGAAPAAAADGATSPPGADGGAPPPAAAAGRADPGPLLKRNTGSRPAEALAPITLKADGRQTHDGAVFVQVPVPRDIGGLPTGPEEEAWLTVEGDRYGLAVPAGEGRMVDRPLFFVRFPGADAPERFVVRWRQGATLDGKPGQTQTVTVEGVGAAPKEADVAARFRDAASSWFDRRGVLGFARRDPFYAYAGARFQALGKKARGQADAIVRRGRRTDMAEMMSLYTGMTSVEEALQTDRGLLQQEFTQKRDLPFSEVEPLELPGHPWDEMIAELPGKPTPAIEPLAAFAPHDALYVHFHDLRTLVKLADEAEALVTPVARVLEERPGDRHFVERYERQLAIERLGLAKTLGHVAAKGIALVASDPFFREGTDLTLLFHLNQKGVLETALGEYERRARARRPDIGESTYDLAGHSVRLLSTADGAVAQHRVLIDDVMVLSNSRAALERVLDTKAGRRMPLSASGDFRYFRARFPFDPEAEDGFAFLSDAFVGHVISPRVKILQARRMQAAADLSAVGFGALLHGWLFGEAPASAEAMVAAGVVDAAELKHGDGSGRITYDPATGARSAAWGTAAALTPLIELPLDRVTLSEKGGYERFRATYQSYWRGYIDPIGVRIARTPDGMRLEARMMPLLQNTEYDQVAEVVGDKRVLPPTLDEGLRFTMAVSEKSSLRRQLDELSRLSTGNRDVGIGWLGDWVMLGFGDRSGLWDMAISLGEVPSVEGRAEYRDPTTRKKVLSRIPLYLGAHVRDKLALAATLTALKGFVQSAAPGIVEWQTADPHRDVPIVRVRETLSAADGIEGVAVHYAIPKDVVLFSLDRATLEAQIDAVLEGRTAKIVASEDAAGAAQSVLALRPSKGDGWMAKTLLGVLERGIVNSNRAGFRAFEALARGLGSKLPTDAEALQAASLGYLGYAPTTAHGGAFRVEDGQVVHSLYGTAVEPVSLPVPVPDSPVSAFVQSLDRLRLTLSFVGEGRHRGLGTTLLWTRR